ncbi:MAG: spondin domain-containing protein [Acidimicrobiia bacterium]
MTATRKLVNTTALLALAGMLFTLIGLAPAQGEPEREYKVTITNLTGGQLQTPFVVATHSGSTSLFEEGSPASTGLQALAENGGVPVLVAELNADPEVGDVVVAGSGPIAPGASAYAIVTSSPGARKLSLAGMLICTNDGFAGLDSVQLNANGKSQVFYGYAYDAGTEINTEAYADLVPPCDGLGQTGMSNPALAEGGVVTLHDGIEGGADLDPTIHGWSGPVIMVTIELQG